MIFSEILDLEVPYETKGQFRYVSWPHAVAFLRAHWPEATWLIRCNNGIPLFLVGSGGMVCVELQQKNEDKTIEEWFPVIDYRNKPIPFDKISSFDVNTAIKRALVKAIAQATGYGLKIYMGEDLPSNVVKEAAKEEGDHNKYDRFISASKTAFDSAETTTMAKEIKDKAEKYARNKKWWDDTAEAIEGMFEETITRILKK